MMIVDGDTYCYDNEEQARLGAIELLTDSRTRRVTLFVNSKNQWEVRLETFSRSIPETEVRGEAYDTLDKFFGHPLEDISELLEGIQKGEKE